MRSKADFVQFIGWVARKENELPSLTKRIAQRAIRCQTSIGLRTVEVERIVGTESRAGDFDSKFNPLNNRSRSRWISIASLRLNEIELPAVELLQVGNEYFVRDGHHRISVAHAIGQAYIEAYVTRIELE